MADVQLKLGVIFDQTVLRAQIAQATRIVNSEFTGRLNVKFNRQTLDKELNNLQRAIKRRVYRVEIGGNIDALPDKIKTLRKQLHGLEGFKVDLGVTAQASLTKKEARKVRTAMRQQLLAEGGKIAVPTTLSPISQTAADKFKADILRKIGTLTIQVKANVEGGFASSPLGAAGLQEYMRTQGLSGGNVPGGAQMARGALFEKTISEASSRDLKRMLAMANVAGRSGLTTKSAMQDALRKISEEAQETILGNLQMSMKGMQPQPPKRAFLDQVARAVFWMAGVDPEYLRRQSAQKRALPAISWPSQLPQRVSGIGPSATGRALPQGAIPERLPGTSFAAQKRLIGDILSPSLKEALRGAANAFVDNVRNQLNSAVRSVSVRDLGNVARAALSPSRIAGILPPAVGRAPSMYSGGGETREQMFARRTAEAYTRSALRGMDVMGGGAGRPPAPYSYAYRSPRPTSAIIPYAAGGAMVPSAAGAGGGALPPSGGRGGGGGLGGIGGFGRALGSVNLPGTSLVRELGNEFSFAAKQVLLFGAAYKALAFIQSFPSQVGAAVGELQSFRNTLSAISPTAQEAATSNGFILSIVEKYNTPLQSAREGFTKLYASMAPAGFSGGEIRDLFLGISQAAATFGMSADKVDRVNYAFAQMASKGQVMSEELKGQLGDVLPGAMAIFAKAAGFKGSEAITKFSKALEDGVYKGQAMKTLLTNVGIVMRQEFGPGAEGAARTFQGVIIRLQNSTKLLYESFEPVAVGFLNSVVMPLTNGVKTIADGFTAFFAGTQAKTAGGGIFAKQLEALRPTFKGIEANIRQVLPLLQTLGNVMLTVGQVMLQIAGNPLIGYLARIYLTVLPLTMALRILNLQVMIPLIGSFLRAIPAFVAFNAAMGSGATTSKALQLSMQLTGQTAAITAGKIRLVGAALATLGTTAIFAAIGILIERFLMMKSAIDGVRQSTQQMLGSISGMANSGAVKELKNVGKDIEKQRETFGELKSFVSGGLFGGEKQLTEAGAKKFEEVGMGSFVTRNLFGRPVITDFLRASKIIEERLQSLDKQASKVAEKLPLAIKVASNLAKQAKVTQTIAPITGGGDEAGKQPKAQSLESDYSLQDQLAKNFTQDQIDRIEAEYQARVNRINAEFDLREARANSFQKEALRYEREISAIELRRQKALLEASNEVLRAQGSVAGGTGGGGKGLGAGIAQYITGDPSSPFYRKDHGGGNYHEHLAFVSRQAAEEAYKKLTSAGIQVTEFKGKSRVGRHSPGSAHYEGLAFDVPGAQVPVGRERELTARVQSILGIGGTGISAPRKITGNEKRDVIADQKTQLAIAQKSLAVQIAEAQAIRDADIAWAQYTAAIAPIEEQKLQNSLLAKKNELMRSGMPDSVIENEMKQFETQQKTAIAIDTVRKMLAEKKISAGDAARQIAELNNNMAVYNGELAKNIALQQQQEFKANMRALNRQLELAGIIDPRQELRTRIRQERPGYSEGQIEEEAAMKERIDRLETAKERIKGIASSIGDSFGTAFKGIITGSMTAQEALAGMFQSIADHFADMVAKMIAEWIKLMVLKGIEAIVNPMAGLGSFAGGANIGQSVAMPSSVGIGAGGGILQNSMGQGFGTFGPNFGIRQFANGGIAPGGFTAFANGGMVTGPTMGLVGEGRYNEAIVPLPDGKSIPVELSGGGSAAPTVIVNVDAKGTKTEGNEQNANQLGRVISAAVQSELIKQQRPGGLLASR